MELKLLVSARVEKFSCTKFDFSLRILGMVASPVSRRKAPGHLVLGSYKFLPYANVNVSKIDALRACVQLALENNQTLKVRAVEVSCKDNDPIIGMLNEILREIPSISVDLKLLSDEGEIIDGVTVENVSVTSMTNCTFVIVTDLLKNKIPVDDVSKCIQDGGYLISRESLSHTEWSTPSTLNVIASMQTENEKLIVLEPIKRKIYGSPRVIKIDNKQFDWINELREAAKENFVILVSQESTSGIIGFVNCLRKESDYKNVRAFFIDDENAPSFSLVHPFYIKQLKLGLAINVYRNVSTRLASFSFTFFVHRNFIVRVNGAAIDT